MKLVRLASIALLSTGLLSCRALCAEELSGGYVDAPVLTPSANGDVVEINLQSGLLSIASRCTDGKDPEVANLIKNLKQVRVNVVKLDDTNRASATEQIHQVRKNLKDHGWQPIVTVKDHKGEDVSILVRTRGDEAIEGLVVSVLSQNDGAVFVNIVGDIRPEQIAKLTKGLDIPGLKNLEIKKAE